MLRAPLIVRKREFYDAFLAGTKTVEYRQAGRQFTVRNFYPGGIVRLTTNYDINRYPSRLARVEAFDVLTSQPSARAAMGPNLTLDTLRRDRASDPLQIQALARGIG